MKKEKSFRFDAMKTHYEEDRAPLFSLVGKWDGADDYRLIVLRMRLDGQVWKESDELSTRQEAMALEPGFVEKAGGHVCNEKCSRWQST